MDMNRMLDIKDMLFQIVRKWKRIFVWMIVFAILFDGYGAVKSYNDAIHAQQTANQTIDPSSYRESLSADRADAVEKAFDLYKQYNEIYESSKEYCDHAIRMKLDYTAVPTVNFMYQVSNCDNITALYTYIDVITAALVIDDNGHCVFSGSGTALDYDVKIEIYLQ